MTSSHFAMATLFIVPAIGLAAWAWFAIAQVDQQLRSFSGFEGMHFDI